MKWFDKWFAKQSKKSWDNANQLSVASNAIYVGDDMRKPGLSGRLGIADQRIDAVGINMKLYVANGGYIIEFLRWDNVKDRHLNELHVINEGEKLGERLSEVIVQYILSNR